MGRIADRLRRRYSETGSGRDKGLATKDDLKHLRRDLDNDLKKQGQQGGAQIAGRTIRMMGRGFGNIGRSLNSPYDTRGPKISQLPQRRRDIGISQSINLDYLKDPKFRGKDLRGRRLK